MATGTYTDWSPALSASGVVSGLDDIAQCIRIILTTPQGSDPHRPDFGVDVAGYLDRPQNILTPALVRACRQAILTYEPRVSDVQFTVRQALGAVTVVVDWLPVAGGSWQQVTVEMKASA